MPSFTLHKFLQIFSFFILLNHAIVAFALSDSQAVKDFATIDQDFVSLYNVKSLSKGQHTRPLLVVKNFDYQLYTKDGKVESFKGLVSPFNELKAVSHIGPALYALGVGAWQNPADPDWKQNLINYQAKIKTALANVDKIDWSNPAWPDKTEELKLFMRDSLQMVDNFLTKTLEKGSLTQSDYEEFASHYMHTMLATMFLADTANTIATLKQLQKWKNKLGKDWDNIYALIHGSKGRTTSELTVETNTAAITVSALMKPENVKSHILIMPMANDFKQVEQTLGDILFAIDMANATFLSKRAKQATGIYKALLNANIPLAKGNVSLITKKQIEANKIDLPIIGILPKDKKYLDKAN